LVRAVTDHYVASPELRQALAGLSRDELVDVIAAGPWWGGALDKAIHDARVQADLRQYQKLCDAAQARADRAHARAMRRMDERRAARQAEVPQG
jgi:cell division septum initiation protein DivIVA